MNVKQMVKEKRIAFITPSTERLYYVPKSMVRRMDAKKRSYLGATVLNKCVKIKPNCGDEVVYVDAKGNLRIPKSLVRRANINKEKVAVLQEKANEIVIV